MKFVFLAIVLSLSTSLFAGSVNVQVYARAAFTCRNVEEQAIWNLQRKCAELNMKLTHYAFGQCAPAGDDGGYVNYLDLTAYGTCSPQKN